MPCGERHSDIRWEEMNTAEAMPPLAQPQGERAGPLPGDLAQAHQVDELLDPVPADAGRAAQDQRKWPAGGCHRAAG
jgi:hypothetical protein